MSVPGVRTVVANLRADGAKELADAIEKEARGYRCSSCHASTNDPGIALVDESGPGPLAGRIIFYCPFCSPEGVRPKPLPNEGADD